MSDSDHAVSLAELRSSALDTLRRSEEWSMSPARWSSVAEVLGELTAALAVADADGVQAAVVDLDLLGPTRATGIGETPTVPVPEPVREEINRLVHAIEATLATRESRGGS